MSQAASHWPETARLWAELGPPLRPSPEDIAFVTAAVADWARRNGAPRALILGVTPELYAMPWPAGTQLLAMDHTQAMIDVVWPGPRESALLADWTAMPLPDASRDVAICDGGFVLLPHPQAHHAMIRELARVLVPGGLCFLRLFTPPETRETPGAIFNDLFAGRIPNMNVLKLRLHAALQEDPRFGVRLGDTWNALHAVAPDLPALAARVGWTQAHTLAINAYRNSDVRYYLFGAKAVQDMFAPAGFECASVQRAGYPLGERCPTLILRRT